MNILHRLTIYTIGDDPELWATGWDIEGVKHLKGPVHIHWKGYADSPLTAFMAVADKLDMYHDQIEYLSKPLGPVAVMS